MSNLWKANTSPKCFVHDFGISPGRRQLKFSCKPLTLTTVLQKSMKCFSFLLLMFLKHTSLVGWRSQGEAPRNAQAGSNAFLHGLFITSGVYILHWHKFSGLQLDLLFWFIARKFSNSFQLELNTYGGLVYKQSLHSVSKNLVNNNTFLCNLFPFAKDQSVFTEKLYLPNWHKQRRKSCWSLADIELVVFKLNGIFELYSKSQFWVPPIDFRVLRDWGLIVLPVFINFLWEFSYMHFAYLSMLKKRQYIGRVI